MATLDAVEVDNPANSGTVEHNVAASKIVTAEPAASEIYHTPH